MKFQPRKQQHQQGQRSVTNRPISNINKPNSNKHNTRPQLQSTRNFITHRSTPSPRSNLYIKQKRCFAINLSTVHSSSTNNPQTSTSATTTTTTTATATDNATTATSSSLSSSPPATTPTAPKFPPRPQLKAPLAITPSAIRRVMDICDAQDPPAKGIRLGVRTRGCSGLSYTMNFADGPLSKLEEQIVIPGSDIKVFIDNKALLYVIGTTMDWTETDVATEFTFNNPNSKGSCGCGESFTV